MDIKALFDRFSRRNRLLIEADREVTTVPLEFRNRVLLRMHHLQRCANTDGWAFVKHQIEVQRASRLKPHETGHPFGAIYNYVWEAEDTEFWEALEVILSYHGYSIHQMGRSSSYSIFEPRVVEKRDLSNAISDINEYLKESSVPYSLVMSREGVSRFEIVGRDFERQSLMEPAIELFRNPLLITAEEDFSSALQAYRSERYDDCATRCGTTVEAVLKVVCEEKNLRYNSGDTGARLYTRVETGLDLPREFKTMLTGVFHIRNPASHGRSAEDRRTTKEEAHLALCMAASSSLYLAEVAGMSMAPHFGLGV